MTETTPVEAIHLWITAAPGDTIGATACGVVPNGDEYTAHMPNVTCSACQAAAAATVTA